jgi:hypothetical protein
VFLYFSFWGWINDRENRRGNQEWAIQRNWQYWVHNTQEEDTKTKNTQHRKLKRRATATGTPLEGGGAMWSYGSWISNYLCNRCLSPLTLRVRTPLKLGVLDTTLCDKVCQWLATGRWFSPGTPVSSTNKTDCHDIIEILLKVALNAINYITMSEVHL